MNGTSTVLSGVFAGRYEIERELGRGGTAIVYLALDRTRGHSVAIKLLRYELAESIAADRFLREIRLNEQLHHPHLLPVLDSGDHEGQLYFVLPHMEGGTLRARLQRETQLPLAETLKITRSIAIALAYAHEKGLVHRDVKPENILFTSGEACLGDFGIARALEHALGMSTTSTSVVRGTPLYMSPEQATGRSTYDRRSDIYSLGCVVYEMLAGIQPYVGPTPESVIAQKVTQPPRPLRIYRASIPKAVEDVISRALAVSPADRYQTATEFADALDAAALLPDVPETSARRWRTMWWAIPVLLLTLAGTALTLREFRSRNAVIARGLAEGDPRRIAVMYFDDLSPSTLPGYVADGTTEDLIDRLSAVRTLHVISPNGMRRFRSGNIGIDSVARALKVGTIVSGSIAREANTVRINVRLSDALTGRQLFSRSLEEQWTQLFALQDRLADQVAFVLRQRLGEEIAVRERRSATRSYQAWETAQFAGETMRSATAAANLRNDPDAVGLYLRADSLYGRAERLDANWNYPTITRGRIALALSIDGVATAPSVDSSAWRSMLLPARRRVWVQRAIHYANVALDRDRRSAEAWALRGDAEYQLMIFGVPRGDTLAPLVRRDLQAALDLRPDMPAPWTTLADLAAQEGRFAEAAAFAERAFEADAFFRMTHVMSIAFLASLRAERYDEARRWCRMGLDHYPGDPRFAECELSLLGWTGQSPREVTTAWQLLSGIERRDSVHMLEPTWGYRRLMVAAILARAGMRDSAQKVLDVVAADGGKRGNTSMFEAYVQLLLGDRERAFAQLKYLLNSTPQFRTLIARHPWFRSLHGDPRFEALVQPARAPTARGSP